MEQLIDGMSLATDLEGLYGPVTVDTQILSHNSHISKEERKKLEDEYEVIEVIVIGKAGVQLAKDDIDQLICHLLELQEAIRQSTGAGCTYFYEGYDAAETQDGYAKLTLKWGTWYLDKGAGHIITLSTRGTDVDRMVHNQWLLTLVTDDS